MNPPRCAAADDVQFLPATPRACSAAEAARAPPGRPGAPAHDAFTRLVRRPEPDPAALWEEVRPLIRTAGGVLAVDDTVPDEPLARHVGLVGSHGSGRHRRVVRGIDPVTLPRADGDARWPCDYRAVNPAAAATKNGPFRGPVRAARARGFTPRCVVLDAWYPGEDNLQAVRDCGRTSPTPARCDRRVNPDRTGTRPIEGCGIAATGTVAHLEGSGRVRAFRIVATGGGTAYRVTDDPTTRRRTRPPGRGTPSGRGGPRSTTAGWSRTAGRRAARCGTPAPSATTAGCPAGRSSGRGGTGPPPGWAGSRPNSGSSGRPSGATWRDPPTASRCLQLPNS